MLIASDMKLSQKIVKCQNSLPSRLFWIALSAMIHWTSFSNNFLGPADEQRSQTKMRREFDKGFFFRFKLFMALLKLYAAKELNKTTRKKKTKQKHTKVNPSAKI